MKIIAKNYSKTRLKKRFKPAVLTWIFAFILCSVFFKSNQRIKLRHESNEYCIKVAHTRICAKVNYVGS